MRPPEVAQALGEIATLLGLGSESKFKAEAYARGAQIVAALGDELDLLIREGALTAIEGIGPSLSKQIQELAQTGRSSLLERLRAEYPPGAAELAQLPGMTLRRIRALSEGLAIRSLEQLQAACEAQRVRALAGFGAKTEEKLLTALRERATPVSDGPLRALLSEAVVLADRVAQQLVPELAERVELAGAARRGEETLDEVELVIVGEAEPVLRRLRRAPELAHFGAEGAEGKEARLPGGAPLRLHVVPREQAGVRLLHATGPRAHVEQLASRAREAGYSLCEDALRGASGEPLQESADERAIYARLGLPFVPAEQRTVAIDPSAAFDDLVAVEHVRGMVHCHTTYSDGRASIEEMARAAEALGMEYITITDHSPTAHYARGVTLDRLKQQWDEIAQVQERVNVRILRGTESDILADGSLDYPDDVLAQFDVVIASIHSRLRMNRAEMTERLVRAMQQPVFKIWGHALGRLLLKRDPIDCDVERVLDALAASRGAVEVNGDPHRLDLPPSWLPAAKERGIPFVLSVDAHSTAGMGALGFAVTMARRGGLRRGDVLNTLPADAFCARVK